MEAILRAQWTVEYVLRTYPQTAAVFLARKMDCVGCPLEGFCTLEDAAKAYELPVQDLLQKLYAAIEFSTPRGEKA